MCIFSIVIYTDSVKTALVQVLFEMIIDRNVMCPNCPNCEGSDISQTSRPAQYKARAVGGHPCSPATVSAPSEATFSGINYLRF